MSSTQGWTSKQHFEFEQLATQANNEQIKAAIRRMDSIYAERVGRG